MGGQVELAAPGGGVGAGEAEGTHRGEQEEWGRPMD